MTAENFEKGKEFFKSPEEERRDQPFITYEETEEDGEKKCYVDIGGIKVETYAAKEDIEKIGGSLKQETEEMGEEILEIKEAIDMLKSIATHYKLRQPLILEGGTALGKSFAVEKFSELIYGKGEEPITFDCSGQTDVSELMAKWVPRTGEEDEKKWKEFITTEKGHKELQVIYKEIEEKRLSEEDAHSLIEKRLESIALKTGIKTKGEWKLQLGAIPRAMTMEGSGGKKGKICHIQEVGLARPEVINALLRTRGHGKKLKKSFQLWENGGKKIEAGENFWMVYTTNPPEAEAGYLERHELDPSLVRASVYKKLANELSEETVDEFADFYFSGGEEKPEVKKETYWIPAEEQIDYQRDKELRSYVSKAIGTFHKSFNKALEQGLEKDRVQKNPITPDHLAASADFLRKFQVKNNETGLIDFPKTIEEAIDTYYLNSLASEEAKEQMRDVWQGLMTGPEGPKINGKSLEKAINERIEQVSISPKEKEKRTEDSYQRFQEEFTKFQKEKIEKIS